MKTSIFLLIAAFLCLFPATIVGKYWPKPSEISKNEMMFLNTARKFSYGDSKVWKCTYSNGSDPAISISPSTPSNPSPSAPSTPKKSPSPPPSTPKKSPSPPPSTPKKSPSVPSKPSPSPPPTPKTPSTPKKSPSKPPSTPKTTPFFPSPSTPKKSPSKPPSTPKTTPFFPPPEHHDQNPLEHIEKCMRNMGSAGLCRMQMDISYYTRMFGVSNYCCNLLKNMRSECDDVVWGFFSDPFFVPLVRYTCHVTC